MMIKIKKSRLKIAFIFTSLITLILLVGFFVKDLNFTGNTIIDSPEDIISDFVNVGEVGVLYTEGSNIVVLARSKEALGELIKTATEEDQEGYYNIFSRGEAYAVPSVTKAGVLERDSTIVKVEILNGEYVGLSGWIFSDWIIK